MQKTICSIFPEPVFARRNYAKRPGGGFLSTWSIDAASPEDPKLLVVSDAFELQRNGSQQKFETPVFGDLLAEDFVNEWRDSRRFTEFGRPGIFICAGDTPTTDELEQAKLGQDLYAEAYFNEAEDMFANGARAAITATHRMWAKYLGRENAPWYNRTERVTTTDCPFCRTKVDSQAIKCRECGGILDEDAWYKAELRRLEAQARLDQKKAELEARYPKPAAHVPAPPEIAPVPQPEDQKSAPALPKPPAPRQGQQQAPAQR